MGCQTVLLFCDICIDKSMRLNLLQCLCFVCGCVEPYRLTVQRHHWHCWLCSYSVSQYDQLRVVPCIPE